MLSRSLSEICRIEMYTLFITTVIIIIIIIIIGIINIYYYYSYLEFYILPH